MINSMNKSEKLITPEKAASFIPIFISAGISILLVIFFVIPEYVRSNKVNLELNGLVKKKNQLENLKSQYKIINQKYEKLTKEKAKIIELISGTSNLDTLLAKFGEIGKKNNIEFVSIVPKNLMNFIDNSSLNNNKKENINVDPLLVEGTKKYLIDFSFKTDFINLLAFLRELEFQDNVIMLNDMNLRLIEEKVNSGEFDNPEGIIDVKLSMTLYGKI